MSSAEGLLLRNVSKTFTATRALTNVSFTLRPGEVHALVGHNGSGKSTLIKILSGYHTADEGSSASLDGESLALGDHAAASAAGIRFVHQNLGLVGTLSVLENLALERGFRVGRFHRIKWRRERERAEAALASTGYQIDVETLVADLTPSERTAVALSRALEGWQGDVRFLVLDEPTAVMPKGEVRRLFAALKQIAASGIGILYVSHHLDEVFEIADRVTVLRDGEAIGPIGIESLDHDELVRLIIGDAGGHHGPATAAAPAAALARAGGVSPGTAALEVEAVSGPGIDGVSFDVAAGEIVGIAGVSGSGRESLLPAIFGMIERAGAVRVAGAPLLASRPDLAIRNRVAMVPSDRAAQGLFPELTLRENLCMAGPAERGLGRLKQRRERDETSEWIRRLNIRPRDGEALVATASGGNQQKAVLARALRLDPQVMLLNDPTQGVDVGARAEIHRIVRDSAKEGAAVVVASADDEELVELCDRVLVMQRGRVQTVLSGEQLSATAVARSVLGA